MGRALLLVAALGAAGCGESSRASGPPGEVRYDAGWPQPVARDAGPRDAGDEGAGAPDAGDAGPDAGDAGPSCDTVSGQSIEPSVLPDPLCDQPVGALPFQVTQLSQCWDCAARRLRLSFEDACAEQTLTLELPIDALVSGQLASREQDALALEDLDGSALDGTVQVSLRRSAVPDGVYVTTPPPAAAGALAFDEAEAADGGRLSGRLLRNVLTPLASRCPLQLDMQLDVDLVGGPETCEGGRQGTRCR